jgi:ABC-2 type transport system ATP-binding protein
MATDVQRTNTKQKCSAFAIEAIGLGKSFGKTKALVGLDVEASAGTILAVLGPNGAGKTTTVRVFTTLLKPNRGSARVAGYDVVTQAPQVRRCIGLAGQSASLDESLTGAANLVMIAQLCRIPRQRAKQRAAELLERFDLADAADRGVKTYSGGMRRRLDLAASLVTSPPVSFLDEPTTGLDPRSRLVMWDIIRTLVADGTTVLLTTQYLEEADQLADQIIVIDDGVLIARGSSKELKDRLGGDRVHVTVAPGSDIAAAREVLARHSDGDVHVDLDHRVIDAPVKAGARSLAVIVSELTSANVLIDDLGVVRPTLDDVFMNLTGHQSDDVDTATKGLELV